MVFNREGIPSAKRQSLSPRVHLRSSPVWRGIRGGIERWLDQYFVHNLRCTSRLPCSLVDFSIFPRRRVPGEIFIHAVTHERLPGSLIAKGHERLLDREQQRLAVVFGELKAGTFAGTCVPGFDGIVEAARGTHDGYGAVFEAVDLVQNTAHVSGWHEEHVRAGFNLVSDGIIVSNLHRTLIGDLLVEASEHFFVGLAAPTQ